jgi:hypothetical protein
MNKLNDQIDAVEKRIKKVDADCKKLVDEAIAKKKQKDTRGKLTKEYSDVQTGYRCSIRSEEKEDARERRSQA